MIQLIPSLLYFPHRIQQSALCCTASFIFSIKTNQKNTGKKENRLISHTQYMRKELLLQMSLQFYSNEQISIIKTLLKNHKISVKKNIPLLHLVLTKAVLSFTEVDLDFNSLYLHQVLKHQLPKYFKISGKFSFLTFSCQNFRIQIVSRQGPCLNMDFLLLLRQQGLDPV